MGTNPSFVLRYDSRFNDELLAFLRGHLKVSLTRCIVVVVVVVVVERGYN
jgi:hypothetical protein